MGVFGGDCDKSLSCPVVEQVTNLVNLGDPLTVLALYRQAGQQVKSDKVTVVHNSVLHQLP